MVDCLICAAAVTSAAAGNLQFSTGVCTANLQKSTFISVVLGGVLSLVAINQFFCILIRVLFSHGVGREKKAD